MIRIRHVRVARSWRFTSFHVSGPLIAAAGGRHPFCESAAGGTRRGVISFAGE